MSQSLPKKNINFILAAFMMFDYDNNGLLDSDFEHYFLNNIVHEEVKGSIEYIFENANDKMSFYRRLLEKMVFEKIILIKSDRYYVNYEIEICKSYLNLYMNLMNGFNIKKRKVFEEDSIYEDENSSFNDIDSFRSKKKDLIKEICVELSDIEISENKEDCNSHNQEYNSTENISSASNSSESTQKCPYKYKLESFTNSKIKYMIDEDFTQCTCDSFKYSFEVPKNCKHLDYCRKVDVSTLKLI